MHNQNNGRFGQSVLSMALTNFDSWLHSPRTIMMLIFLLTAGFIQTCELKNYLNELGFTIHFGEMLFCEFNTGCDMAMTTIIFLIVVSEMPRRIAFQEYALIRSSRTRWIIAQFIYCLMMVVTMLVLLFVAVSVTSLPITTPGTGWSDLERIAAGVIDPDYGLTLVPKYILNQFNPLSALFIAMIPMFCFWMTMILMILLFGVWGSALVGVMFYAFLVFIHLTVFWDWFSERLKFPFHYSTLNSLTSGYYGMEIEILIKSVGIYALLMIGLMLAAIVSVKRADLAFDSDSNM